MDTQRYVFLFYWFDHYGFFFYAAMALLIQHSIYRCTIMVFENHKSQSPDHCHQKELDFYPFGETFQSNCNLVVDD